MARKPRSRYACQGCGHSASQWFGRCPGCGEWNTCVEERTAPADPHRGDREPASVAGPQPITEVTGYDAARIPIGIGEFDRVLGGGIMPGSVVLVGGDPGIGKSTLLLQMAGQLAAARVPVLYVSAEESSPQVRLRAERLGAMCASLYVLCETDLGSILEHLRRRQAAAAVVDSIQTIYSAELESAPGSVAQVRECAARLVYFAKESGIPVFLVGHVTKEGTVAGPRVLEHLVDTVLYLEGEQQHHFRVLRAAKNRFGSTNEIGVFEMQDRGLAEVRNPSASLLSDRASGVSGASVVCSLEGTRPLLVELQALVSRSSFGYPQRVATGIDPKRLAIIIAVLEKRGGFDLSGHDIFVNVVGGLRLEEPAVDLGIGLAVASSLLDRPLAPDTVAIGEIGLGGEIRPVSQIERRVVEARSLGFGRCLVAARNLSAWKRPEGMEVVGLKNIEEACEVALGRSR
ncbi:MAG: DNA repair protein RadA [Gemmatimonadota bacterium]